MAGGGNLNMGGCAIIGVLILAAIGSCLPKKEEKSAQSSVRYVAARSLNCRASDSIGAAVVRSFRRDDSVTVAEERGDRARTVAGSRRAFWQAPPAGLARRKPATSRRPRWPQGALRD